MLSFHPAVNSTTSQSLLNQPGTIVDFNHANREWNREMSEDILPRKSEAHKVLHLAKLSPNGEVEKMFDSVAEVLTLLDNFYTDKFAASKSITGEFLSLMSIEGAKIKEVI